MRCTTIFYDIYKISKKCIYYTHFLGEEVGIKAYGLDDVFPRDTSGLVRMLGAICVVCNKLLFSFSNLDLTFTYHSSVTSWCVLNETTKCRPKRQYIYKFCFYGPCVHFGIFFWPPRS